MILHGPEREKVRNAERQGKRMDAEEFAGRDAHGYPTTAMDPDEFRKNLAKLKAKLNLKTV